MIAGNSEEVCALYWLHNNRVGVCGNIIYFLTCFVRHKILEPYH